MKYAFVLGNTAGALESPAENTPTVIAVAATSAQPAALAVISGILETLNATQGAAGTFPGGEFHVAYVRVEEAVVIGDKLEISGDVWHKQIIA